MNSWKESLEKADDFQKEVESFYKKASAYSKKNKLNFFKKVWFFYQATIILTLSIFLRMVGAVKIEMKKQRRGRR